MPNISYLLTQQPFPLDAITFTFFGIYGLELLVGLCIFFKHSRHLKRAHLVFKGSRLEYSFALLVVSMDFLFSLYTRGIAFHTFYFAGWVIAALTLLLTKIHLEHKQSNN